MALPPQPGARQLLLLEARVSFIEQTLIGLNFIADPGPWDTARGSDPLPSDIARFTQHELENAVRDINAEIARLKSVETLLQQRLAELTAKPATS